MRTIQSGRERGSVTPHRSSDRYSRREVDRRRQPATPGAPRQVVSRRDVDGPRRSGGRYLAADRSPARRGAETVPTEDSQPAVSSHDLAGFRQRRDAGRRLLSRQPPAEQLCRMKKEGRGTRTGRRQKVRPVCRRIAASDTFCVSPVPGLAEIGNRSKSPFLPRRPLTRFQKAMPFPKPSSPGRL